MAQDTIHQIADNRAAQSRSGLSTHAYMRVRRRVREVLRQYAHQHPDEAKLVHSDDNQTMTIMVLNGTKRAGFEFAVHSEWFTRLRWHIGASESSYSSGPDGDRMELKLNEEGSLIFADQNGYSSVDGLVENTIQPILK